MINYLVKFLQRRPANGVAAILYFVWAVVSAKLEAMGIGAGKTLAIAGAGVLFLCAAQIALLAAEQRSLGAHSPRRAPTAGSAVKWAMLALAFGYLLYKSALWLSMTWNIVLAEYESTAGGGLAAYDCIIPSLTCLVLWLFFSYENRPARMGIVSMLAVPFLLVAIFGFAWMFESDLEKGFRFSSANMSFLSFLCGAIALVLPSMSPIDLRLPHVRAVDPG